MKSLLSAGTFSPIAVLKIYLPKGQVVRAFSVVRPKIYLSRAIGRVGISSPGVLLIQRQLAIEVFSNTVNFLSLFQVSEWDCWTGLFQGSYWVIDSNPPEDPLPVRKRPRRPNERVSERCLVS